MLVNTRPPTLQESKRAWVIPSKVENLYKCWWRDGKLNADHYPTMDEVRQTVQDNLRTLRQDHKRSLNPTPYKVGGSSWDRSHFCLLHPCGHHISIIYQLNHD